MKNNKYKSIASNVKLKHEVGNKKLNSNNDFQFYEGQYDPKLRRKIQLRAEANKPVNTTSEIIFDDKTMTAKRNPNAKIGLEIVSPEFQIFTSGVGSLAGKATTLIGKFGRTMLHGAGQGAMANMSNLSGSEQNLEGLATDVLGGAVVGGALKGAGIGAKVAKKNAYKINPWAFKPSSDNLYRGLGESGVKDAFESGVLRPRPVELRDIGKDIVTESGKTFRLKGKTFDKTYYSPEFKIADRYGNGYIAEVPKNAATFNNRYSTGKDWSMHTTEQIPIDKANILKKDWLMGYKKINAPKKQFKSEINWGKWNSEIPSNKPLMDEYLQIEKTAKQNGTWMKNPNGSTFKGTPEQFVQQNSSNFKKAFPSPILNKKGNIQTNYHGTPQPLENSYFRKNTNRGEIGTGIYTTTDKGYANAFANSYVGNQTKKDISPTIYELYQNSNNPQLFYKEYYEDILKKDIKKFNIETLLIPKFTKTYKTKSDMFNKKFSDIHSKLFKEGKLHLMPEYDSFTKGHQTVVPFNNYPKSAIGNNGMFDMTNPNIYKGLIPAAGLYGLNKDQK